MKLIALLRRSPGTFLFYVDFFSCSLCLIESCSDFTVHFKALKKFYPLLSTCLSIYYRSEFDSNFLLCTEACIILKDAQ